MSTQIDNALKDCYKLKISQNCSAVLSALDTCTKAAAGTAINAALLGDDQSKIYADTAKASCEIVLGHWQHLTRLLGGTPTAERVAKARRIFAEVMTNMEVAMDMKRKTSK